MAELAGTGADGDRDLIAAAQALLDLIGEAGGAGKYAVDARGAMGVQVGDHNRQDNVFNAPATARHSQYAPPSGAGLGWLVTPFAATGLS